MGLEGPLRAIHRDLQGFGQCGFLQNLVHGCPLIFRHVHTARLHS